MSTEHLDALRQAVEKIHRDAMPPRLADCIERLYARGLTRRAVELYVVTIVRRAAGQAHTMTELMILQYLDDREQRLGTVQADAHPTVTD